MFVFPFPTLNFIVPFSSSSTKMDLVKEATLFRAALFALLPLSYIARHSLPFSWHFRILLPYIIKRWKSRIFQSFSASSSKNNKITSGYPSLQLNDLPIGKDPFQDSTTRSFTATIDDCDIFGHLSNSCYPKNLDIARSYYAAATIFQFQADGGWVALGSISFKFIREIPVLSRYQIRCSIYFMTDKWLYLKNEFVTKDKKGKEILNCESISKHCYKSGRKTIPPWFLLAYCGYSPSTSSDRMGNWKKSQALRLRLQKGNSKTNPLVAYQPGNKDGEEWMKPEYWDLGDWREDSTEKLKELYQYY